MTGWTIAPVRRVFKIVNGGTPTSDSVNWDGDVQWATPVDLGNREGGRIATTARTLTVEGLQSGSTEVPCGSLIISTRAPIGYVAQTAAPMAFNQGCKGLVPNQSVDIRFYRFVFSALNPSLQARGQGATFVELSSDALGSLPIPLPPLDAQRAIADFLDAETARIDALIEKKRRMGKLIQLKAASSLAAAMESHGFVFPESLDPDWGSLPLPEHWRVLHLSQVLDRLTNGFVGPTRDILHDDGIPYIQSLHIKNGMIDFQRRPFFVAEQWHRDRPRVHLRPEDVLIVQTGDIGQVAVVPPNFGEASCHALQIARVRSAVISGSYLGEYLRTPFGYHSLLMRATGALHPHLEGGIRDVPVVVPPKDVQETLVINSRLNRRATDRLIGKLDVQGDLLAEHRQALISAAVMGELGIVGVAA